jgi:hypothetical protein
MEGVSVHLHIRHGGSTRSATEEDVNGGEEQQGSRREEGMDDVN